MVISTNFLFLVSLTFQYKIIVIMMRAFCLFVLLAFGQVVYGQALPRGAWKLNTADGNTVTMIIVDDYLVITEFSRERKLFGYTEGGTAALDGGHVVYTPEFNSRDSTQVGKVTRIPFSTGKGQLSFSYGPFKSWSLVDDAAGHAMAGVWHITERANGGVGPLVRIHQTGPRKTLKILSGTCFQWVAMNPAVKGFYGTGGGTYTAKDGKYTEHISFFSRDNSRVGAALSFNWSLENGKWDHSGKSSKGDPIHETWERVKP